MTTEKAIEIERAEGEVESAGGLGLYYQCWRPRGVTPRAVVAVVHGFGGHSGLYEPLADGLVPRGYALYALDLRGMGRSPGPRGYVRTWDELQQDVTALLRVAGEREPGRSLFLVGESMGGLIVLEYAERRSEGLRGVIALSPLLGQPGISRFLLLLARVLSRVWPRFSLETRLDQSAASRDPVAVQRLTDDPLIHSRGTARLGAEMSAAIARTQDGAGGLSVPLLILLGTSDTIVPPEGTRAFFANVTNEDKELREYEGAFHLLPHDLCADEMMRDIEEWIERHL